MQTTMKRAADLAAGDRIVGLTSGLDIDVTDVVVDVSEPETRTAWTDGDEPVEVSSEVVIVQAQDVDTGVVASRRHRADTTFEVAVD